MDIVWAEDKTGRTIFIQSYDSKSQFDEMMKAYSKYMAMRNVKAFKMPLDELIVDVKIDTEL